MFRRTFLTVGLSPFFTAQLSAQPAVDQDILDLAMVLTVAHENLGRDVGEFDANAVRELLATTKKTLKGTPSRLLERLSLEPDVKQELTGKIIREILHSTHPMQLCFSGDGRPIASGLRGVPYNRHLGVFEVATGKTVFDRAKHGKGITGVVFLDDDKCLLSTAADGTMRFWHVPSGTELLKMKISDSIYQPSCHANGSTILWNQRGGPRYFSLK